METAQLYNGLTFLAYSTGVIVLLVGAIQDIVFELAI